MTINYDHFVKLESKFAQYIEGWREGTPCWNTDDSILKANIRAWVEWHPTPNEENFARFCLHNLSLLTWWLELNIKYLSMEDLATNTTVELILKIIFLRVVSKRHLSAYLEIIGYNAAKELSVKLQNQDTSRTLPPDNSVEQIFPIAWLAAANPTQFFCKFDKQKNSLVAYTRSKMKGIIKDEIFGQKYPAIKYGKYGLLRKLGERKRKEALERQGYRLQEAVLFNLLLAWECFYQICTPNSQGRIQPTSEHWQAIANQYNKLRKNLPTGAACQMVDEQTVKNWIDNICIPAARNYLDPPSISIDGNNQDPDERDIDIADPNPSPDSLLEQGEMNEITQQFKQFNAKFNFLEWMAKLKPEAQAVLLLL